MKKIIAILVFLISVDLYASVKGGKVGVNFQYGTNLSSIGVWWHIIDLIAINPYFGYSSTTDKYTQISGGNGIGCSAATPCTRSNTTSGFTAGIEIPFYVLHFNILDFFVAPGIAYTSKTNTDTYENASNGQSIETKFALPTWNFGLYVGLQIPVLEQLHVFGKAGIDYSVTSYDHASAPTNAGYLDKTTAIAITRYSVGAIFYFN